MTQLALEARQQLPTRGVCGALGLARATLYRRVGRERAAAPVAPPASPRPHHRALSGAERDAVLAVLHSDRFADMAPAAVYATLLDEGRYLCSIRTMYRLLAARGEVRERRAQATHPAREAPRLVATAPNQVWTWDISHLRTHARGATLKLYACLDLYSRHVVGWRVSASESAAEAAAFLRHLARRHGVAPQSLVVHADNGAPMRGRPLAGLLEALGIERSHSRPRTSNDNAFSESQFKTMKYRPTYPRRFDDIAHARRWCSDFFGWYNNEHRHEGIALLTPADVFHGRAGQRLAERARVLQAAGRRHPERFVRGTPRPATLATEVRINPRPPASTHDDGTTTLQEM